MRREELFMSDAELAASIEESLSPRPADLLVDTLQREIDRLTAERDDATAVANDAFYTWLLDGGDVYDERTERLQAWGITTGQIAVPDDDKRRDQ